MNKTNLGKKLAAISAFLVVVAGALVTLPEISLTGSATETRNYEGTHTKAICNESNFCQDHKITCKNGTVQETSPITGATVQHPEDWKDPRENPDQLC